MSKILRLFQVRDTSTNKVLSQMFHDKAHAKQYRNELNTLNNSENRFVTTYGPDHHKYKA